MFSKLRLGSYDCAPTNGNNEYCLQDQSHPMVPFKSILNKVTFSVRIRLN